MSTTEQKIAELRNKIDELEASLKEEDKFDYPICKIDERLGLIVLFTDLKKGRVLCQGASFHEEGLTSPSWIPHTDTEVWKDYPYDKERGLYHKQMVYCWDNYYTHRVEIRFYDAINECAFAFGGCSSETEFEYYSATMPEFIKEAHKTLKD